jgi:hypothetical protein
MTAPLTEARMADALAKLGATQTRHLTATVIADVERWGFELARTTAYSFEAATVAVRDVLACSNLTVRDLQRLVQRNHQLSPIDVLYLLRAGESRCLNLRMDDPLCRVYPETIRRCAQLTGVTR